MEVHLLTNLMWAVAKLGANPLDGALFQGCIRQILPRCSCPTLSLNQVTCSPQNAPDPARARPALSLKPQQQPGSLGLILHIVEPGFRV